MGREALGGRRNKPQLPHTWGPGRALSPCRVTWMSHILLGLVFSLSVYNKFLVASAVLPNLYIA